MLNYSWNYGKKRHYKHTNVCFEFSLSLVVTIRSRIPSGHNNHSIKRANNPVSACPSICEDFPTSLPLLWLSFLFGGMHLLEFEDSIADALAYFQSARTPRNAFRPWVFCDFGKTVGTLELKKALNNTELISKYFLKLRVQVNLQYDCIILCN